MPRLVTLHTLRKPQIKILHALCKSRRMLSRKQIAAKSGVDPTKIGDYAGPRPFNQSEKAQSRWNFPALVSLGLVYVEQHDVSGKDLMLYSITDKGRRLMERSYAKTKK